MSKQLFYHNEEVRSLMSEARLTYFCMGFLLGCIAMFGLMLWIASALGL